MPLVLGALVDELGVALGARASTLAVGLIGQGPIDPGHQQSEGGQGRDQREKKFLSHVEASLLMTDHILSPIVLMIIIHIANVTTSNSLLRNCLRMMAPPGASVG
jgi:hypothetical protein